MSSLKKKGTELFSKVQLKRRLTYWPKLFLSKFRFIVVLWKMQQEKNISSLAQSLAYTSIVSLVPIAAIFFSILGVLTKNDAIQDKIKDFISNNFLPQSVTQIFDKLEELSEASIAFGAIGIPSLFITGVFLYMKVDYSINTIWDSNTKKAWFKNGLAFFMTIVFGPMLLVAAFSVPAYLRTLPYYQNVMENSFVATLYRHLIPVSVAGIGLTVLFMYIPSKRVRFKAALIGALTSSVLLHISNGLVNWYLVNFSNFDVVFGSLAIIPIFLLWIFVIWLVVLIGAAVAYIIQSYTRLGNVLHLDYEADESLLSSAVRVLCFIVQSFEQKNLAPDFDQIQILLRTPKDRLELIIELLREKHFIIAFDDKKEGDYLVTCYQPGFAPHQMKLIDVIKLFHKSTESEVFDNNINYILGLFNAHPLLIKNKDITFADIIRNPMHVISKVEVQSQIEVSDIGSAKNLESLKQKEVVLGNLDTAN